MSTTPENTFEPGPATKDMRDALMQRYAEASERFARAGAGLLPMSYQDAKRLGEERKQALADYYEALPRKPLSRCPICGGILHRAIDTWGLDGFWWQEELGRTARELPVCAHFRVLTGALNLEGHPVYGGREEAFPGPEVPYVVPRLLGLPTMVAVISSFRLANGYRAYPIAYYSEVEPKPGTLTQTWTRHSYNFRDANGRPSFTYDTSPWDFDLLPWIRRGSIAWIGPDDRSLTVVRTPAEAFPYAVVAGRRQPLAIKGDRLRTLTLPDGRKINPFSE